MKRILPVLLLVASAGCSSSSKKPEGEDVATAARQSASPPPSSSADARPLASTSSQAAASAGRGAGPRPACEVPAALPDRHRTTLPVAKATALTVVDAGKEPRRPLRYDFAEGLRQRAEVTIGGRVRTFSALVRCRDDEGVLVQVEDWRQNLYLDGTMVELTPAGVVKRAFVDLDVPLKKGPPEVALPVLVLPEEAVGLGAVLEHVRGEAVVETTRYTITKLEPFAVELSLQIEQKRTEATPTTQMLASGTGKVVIDLRGPLVAEEKVISFEGDLGPSRTQLEVATDPRCLAVCVEEGRCHRDETGCRPAGDDCRFAKVCLRDQRCSIGTRKCVTAAEVEPLGGDVDDSESERQRELIENYLNQR